jgi:hypothetical protein
MSEVTELIAALRAGTMTLDQVALRFRQRKWPEPARPDPQTAPEIDARAMDDPDPYIPGSFDDVLIAYDKGELTLGEYEVLARAAAEAINAEDRCRAEAGGPDSVR